MSGVNGACELSGVIPVYKPQGWTSFDVIAKLRGVLHIKRLGHAGTLDPMAVGVLPVFVGKAARCCDILPDKRKSYRAGFKLGISTDTQDTTGEVLESSDMPVSGDELKAAAERFVGDIMQLPPMYSAVKINGKKLYELAREGKSVERKPRPAQVARIEITEYSPEKREGVMEIDCGQGTYVRTIINDIGEALGCGGAMTSLIRTRSGAYTLEDCLTIEQIAESCAEGRLAEILLPTDGVFVCYPQVKLGERETALYRNGVKLRPEQVQAEQTEATCRVYAADGAFIGLGGFKDGAFAVIKNF